MSRSTVSDVVVVLPGITGSILERRGRGVWNPTASTILEALRTMGRSLEQLQLFDDPPDLDMLDDGVSAPRVVPDTHLVPGLWKIDGYTKLLDYLQSHFTVDLGYNLIPFPYDWRRDNRVAARRLSSDSKVWLSNWREHSGNADAKLVLLCHSMGGLVARYFLEVLDGWQDTRILITFGTPYRGSLNALNFLANGFRKASGLLDLSQLLRSFTSVYQLLPIYPCLDLGDGQLLRVKDAPSIPNVDQVRAGAADRFHREIEEAVEQHRADQQYLDDGYAIHPLVGIMQRTRQTALLSGAGLEILWTDRGRDLGGDGTVPRVSATPIELSNAGREVYASSPHASLQNTPALIQQVDGLLSDLSIQPYLDQYRALDDISISLDIEDAYLANEPLRVRAQSVSTAPDPSTTPPLVVFPELQARIHDVKDDYVVAMGTMSDSGDGWQQLNVEPLPPGAYRAVVEDSTRQVSPSADVFIVL